MWGIGEHQCQISWTKLSVLSSDEIMQSQPCQIIPRNVSYVPHSTVKCKDPLPLSLFRAHYKESLLTDQGTQIFSDGFHFDFL